ncbi:MAG TPA: HD domain-containing phosphohydrolase [Coriobacteriia bacterium]
MRFQPFGRHLHNQIVMPMLVASLCVAFIATFVGVYRLSGIVDTWVTGSVIQASAEARSQFAESAGRLQVDSKLIAEEPRIAPAVARSDWAAVERVFVGIRKSVQVDELLLLDEDGAVVAQSGASGIAIGERPLDERYRAYIGIDMRFVTLMNLGGAEMLASVRSQTFDGPTGPRTFTLVAARVIDEDFLRMQFRGVAAAVAYIDADRAIQARYIDPELVVASGAAPDPQAAQQLRGQLNLGVPEIAQAVSDLDRTVTFSAGAEEFAMRATEVSFSTGSAAGEAEESALVDPTGTKRFVLILLNNDVASATRSTTIGLIAFWSAIAVVVLTGLGTLIARRVSAPLTHLSESARRVADGDFSARVEMGGTNEVSELAESFNVMTESLKERTETLTKKVLELATLYEMSRALGSTLDLEVLLDSVLDSALRIFNVESGYVMIRDKVAGALELRAWRGMTAVKPDDRAVRSSMSDWVVRQGRPLIFNPPADETSEQHVDSVTGALAALCVPLVSSEGVIGSICVGSRDRSYRFSSDDVRLLSTIANHVTIAIGNIELFSSLQDAYLATVRSLAAAVDAKDPFTRGHSDRVAACARAIAERLGLSSEQCTALEMAAYLHDIGKIGIRESILLKPGKLDVEEFGQMKHHPLIGANILRPVAFPWPIAPVVRHHHEHFDGQGYPAGLKGEEIPLLARILTVADAFEAMTADRPYRSGRTQPEAVDELRRCSGSHFDPRIIDAFMGALQDMDMEAAARTSRAVEAVQPEEARAIFVAVCDGMFGGFRRLGGPRLASNLESALEEYLRASNMPYALNNGHMTVDWEQAGEPERQVGDMRDVVRRLAALMEATAGRSLVDHFYDEAVEALSDRMRHLSTALDLYDRQ